MSIVQSPEQREHSRRVLLPWLVRLRRWRQQAVARVLRRKKHKLSKDSLASLKAYGKQQVKILKERKRAEKAAAKIERKAEKTRLRLVKKEPTKVHIAYDLDTPNETFPDPKHGRHRWHG